MPIDLTLDASLLIRMWSLVTALRGTTLRSAKIQLLTDAIADPKIGALVASVLRQVYQPLVVHNITSGSANKFKPSSYPELEEFTHKVLTKIHLHCPVNQPLFLLIFKGLASRRWTGHKALAVWNAYRDQFKHAEIRDMLDLILDRDLKAGVAVSSVNEALVANKRPEIEVFSVALGESAKKAKAPNFESAQWFASRKLDGVRCIAIRTEHGVSLYSRSGTKLSNFKHIEEAVADLPPNIYKPYLIQGGLVLDGELALNTPDGGDDFAGLMKRLRRKNQQVPEASLHCFDSMSVQTFMTRFSKSAWDARQFQLKRVIKAHGGSVLRLVEQTLIEDPVQLSEAVENAKKAGFEGIILRRNTTYAGKRSHDIIKYKKLESCEMTVDRLIGGRMSVKSGEGLAEVRIMSAAVCVHDRGFEVKVGSGWSVEERRYFIENPGALVGKVITVEYMEETKDSKTGVPSLRFPIFKVLHGKKRKL